VVARLAELVAMARRPDDGRTLLVELKAVGPAYPLYGALATSPPSALGALLTGDAVVVGHELLDRLDLSVGGGLAIGARTFTIAGVVDKEPDRSASLMTLGPRVMMSPESLEGTGLVVHGSRVRYRTLLRLPGELAPKAARDELARRISSPEVRVSGFDEAQPGLRKFFTQLTVYLGLVGLASLLVGGIGVASSVTTFMQREQPTIAILKALGAESRALVWAYLVETQAVALAASVTGAVLGTVLQPALIRVLGGLVPFALEARPEPWTALRGVALGLLATLLCALWPVLSARSVRPSMLLRSVVEPVPGGGRRPWLTGAVVGGGLAALTLWQAGSVKVGLIFVVAAVASLAALTLLARGLGGVARRLPRPRSPAWRHGLAALGRPGGHTARVVVSLGVGVMLLVAVALLEASLGREVDHETKREAPSFFFVDVQADQRDAFARLVAPVTGGAPPLTPIVRARLAAIDGVPVTRQMIERREARGEERVWYLTREYVLTWSGEPPAQNRLARGRWWTTAEAAMRPRVSVEDVAARVLGVDVGSRLTFEIQGVSIEAEVMSLRTVDWQSLSMNFFMILSPGALEGAPATYIATARVPPAAERGLQDAVVGAFPNVTVVPVRDILERVGIVLGEIAVAIRLIALFTLGAGLVVLAGALAATRYQRLYESVVFRTLGATRALVARAFAVEYACLGVTAGLGGTALAALLAWIVLRFVLETPWSLEPGALAAGVLASVVLAVGVGLGTTFRLLGVKPLAVMRRE
ncbi:MAG: ABC transporter permease, partial [Candidatus Rokuibacteriota bacterium]